MKPPFPFPPAPLRSRFGVARQGGKAQFLLLPLWEKVGKGVKPNKAKLPNCPNAGTDNYHVFRIFLLLKENIRKT
jgi:hypothetical protein